MAGQMQSCSCNRYKFTKCKITADSEQSMTKPRRRL